MRNSNLFAGRYLQAGPVRGRTVSRRSEGTPQGGSLSPLLSDILIDESDKELEKRGHAFCRYADDAKCTFARNTTSHSSFGHG